MLGGIEQCHAMPTNFVFQSVSVFSSLLKREIRIGYPDALSEMFRKDWFRKKIGKR